MRGRVRGAGSLVNLVDLGLYGFTVFSEFRVNLNLESKCSS